MAHFSGFPKTVWTDEDDHRNMKLLDELSFTDNDGKVWVVPDDAVLNGATIPRAFWTTVGAPFVGRYRRASVVHDYFVGEGNNPDVSQEERRKADKMFYEACLADGCKRGFAALLYIGVRTGTWASGISGFQKHSVVQDFREVPIDKVMQAKFDEVRLSVGMDLETIEFNELEQRVDLLLNQN